MANKLEASFDSVKLLSVHVYCAQRGLSAQFHPLQLWQQGQRNEQGGVIGLCPISQHASMPASVIGKQTRQYACCTHSSILGFCCTNQRNIVLFCWLHKKTFVVNVCVQLLQMAHIFLELVLLAHIPLHTQRDENDVSNLFLQLVPLKSVATCGEFAHGARTTQAQCWLLG